MGRIHDQDGTIRVGPHERAEARKRIDDDPALKQRDVPVSADNTISDGGLGAAAAAPEGDLRAGEPVGEYVIEEVLGRGGFGVVYRAVQPLIGKRVAIKVLSRKFSADPEMVSRFIAEAKAVNQIRHRHIIDIFSFGALPDGRQYYVAELLEGEPLDQALAANGKLAPAVAIPILRSVARALDAAHAKGVAHRDLKPENIYLAKDEDGNAFPKLLDFGIAKLSNAEPQAHKTNTGVPIGTPYYMSPEQCRGQGVDHRTDIYSLGVVTYRLLTGKYPFDGALVDILHKQVYEEPAPPSHRNPALEPHHDAAIAWMMRKDPSERPKSATEAIIALQGDLALPATPSQFPGVTTARLPRAPKSGRWIAAVAALVVAAAATAVVLMLVLDKKSSPPPTPQQQQAVTPPPPTSDAAVAAVAATAPPVDAPEHAKTVIVNVTGVPEGTEVLVGNKLIGHAPGPLQLDRSTDKLVLTFRADGHYPLPKTIVPSADQELKLQLKRKRGGGRPRNPDGRDDDIIDAFGKEPK